MKWIEIAKTYLGVKEVKGPQHNPKIVDMWKKIKRGGIKDDETPWCAAFVGACLEIAGIVSTRFESAKSYLKWGVELSAPKMGCIVVFDRDGGGHVGFVVGVDKEGNLQVLGGNQQDMVKVSSFGRSRVAKGGYRWPEGVPISEDPLPVYANGAPVSTKES